MRMIICLGLLLLLITSCGELAYKQGASAKDLEVTKKTCQNAGNEAAVEKCLEDNGWLVQKLGTIDLPDSELFATASVSADNRMSNEAKRETQTSSVEKNTSSETLSKAASAETLAISNKAGETALNNANKPIKKETAIAPPINPFEQYKINSWWKMGGGRDALELSISACAAKLGEAHLPDRKTQTFTRAFAACMYEKGWRGLREKSVSGA